MVIRLGAQIRFIALVVKCSAAVIVIVIEREGG